MLKPHEYDASWSSTHQLLTGAFHGNTSRFQIMYKWLNYWLFKKVSHWKNTSFAISITCLKQTARSLSYCNYLYTIHTYSVKSNFTMSYCLDTVILIQSSDKMKVLYQCFDTYNNLIFWILFECLQFLLQSKFNFNAISW